MATPVSRSEEKSTSHSQLMSRPSAYSSLMAIMVSQPSGVKDASDRRNPMGFLTSSSSTGEPFTSMTSPRPNAGVTSAAASIMACVVECAKSIMRCEIPTCRNSSSVTFSSNGRNIACASDTTARTTASAAAALYRLYTPSSLTPVSYVSPSMPKLARWSPTASKVTSACSCSAIAASSDFSAFSPVFAITAASSISIFADDSADSDKSTPTDTSVSVADSASTVVRMSSSDGKKLRNDPSRPKYRTSTPSSVCATSASRAMRGSSRLSTTVPVVASAALLSSRAVLSISPKRSSWSRITLSSRQ